MKFKNILLMAVASVALCGCMGKSVQPGNEGILIKSIGSNAGVQEQPLQVGWHALGFGETILEYPTITRNYSFTAPGDGDNKGADEQIRFADATGLPLSADIQVTLAVDPTKVADIYKKYRLDFSDLLDGPVRSEIRTSIAMEASKVQTMDLMSTQRQTVMQAALVDVQKHFNNTGIVISDMQWLGNIRAPDSVVNAIQQRTQVEQQTQVAIQRQKQAEAEGAANIAKAEADAKVKQLEASALNSAGGEKSIQMAWIAKWKGDVPTYVTGNSPMTMMMPVAGK